MPNLFKLNNNNMQNKVLKQLKSNMKHSEINTPIQSFNLLFALIINKVTLT